MLARIRRRLTSARGAVDLASIMVGVIVVGILSGVTAATVLAVIPWAGEHAAQQNLDAVTTAESVQYARSQDPGPAKYLIDYDGLNPATPTLDTAGLLHHKPNEAVSAITNYYGTAFIARSIAPSGTRYYATSDGDHATAKKAEPLPAVIHEFAKTNTILVWVDEPAAVAPFTEMWSWGNSVDHALDARGEGYTQMLPATVATFADARHLKRVNLSVPWAADSGGPITDWLTQSVTALHNKGIKAVQLGGDNEWVDNPTLVSTWINAGRNAAPFDAVQLDIEPWSNNPSWRTDTNAISKYLTMLHEAENTAHSRGLTLGLDVPWWFASTSYQGGTVLDAVAPIIDRAIVVAFSDHADVKDGQNGIVALAQPAADALEHAGIDFTIGVETDTAAIAGGNEFTFNEEGEHVLEEESIKVGAAFAGLSHFDGICVEHYRSWVVLGN